MRVLTVKEMREADEYTINVLGISSDILVERAGTAVFEEIIKRFKGGRVLVLAGSGNNGNDAKVVAKMLSTVHGFSVTLFENLDSFSILEKDFDIIIDGLFGTGLKRNIEGNYYDIISKINAKKAYKISIDIPSGINGDNGLIMGIAVKANLTVAIQEYKLGHFLGDGIDYSGELIKKDIGISLWGETYAELIKEDYVKRFFPKLKRKVNKGDFGKGGVIGGSKEYTGAPLLSLSSLCALKMGAGYAYLGIEKDLLPLYIGLNPECIVYAYDEKEDLDKLFNLDAIAVGMGLGKSQKAFELIKYILLNYTGKLLIDADGLNAISKDLTLLKNKKCQVILTPHIKEFARLTGKTVEEVNKNGVELAKEFASSYNVVVLLKNAVSIITDGREVFVNTRGTSGQAKAGSGDVLSGIIVGLLARGISVFDGGKVGSYLFGRAGELAKKELTDYVMTATDVISKLSEVIKSFE